MYIHILRHSPRQKLCQPFQRILPTISSLYIAAVPNFYDIACNRPWCNLYPSCCNGLLDFLDIFRCIVFPFFPFFPFYLKTAKLNLLAYHRKSVVNVAKEKNRLRKYMEKRRLQGEREREFLQLKLWKRGDILYILQIFGLRETFKSGKKCLESVCI